MQALVLRAGLVAALALAGCGGSSSSSTTKSSDFKTGLSSAVNKLEDTSTAIGKAIENASSQTDAQIATTFNKLAQQWQSDVSQLETLKRLRAHIAELLRDRGEGQREQRGQ